MKGLQTDNLSTKETFQQSLLIFAAVFLAKVHTTHFECESRFGLCHSGLETAAKRSDQKRDKVTDEKHWSYQIWTFFGEEEEVVTGFCLSSCHGASIFDRVHPSCSKHDFPISILREELECCKSYLYSFSTFSVEDVSPVLVHSDFCSKVLVKAWMRTKFHFCCFHFSCLLTKIYFCSFSLFISFNQDLFLLVSLFKSFNLAAVQN